MAGGRGDRMSASGGPTAKTLVEVVGVPLLERNVHALLRAGVRDMVVSVGPHVPEVIGFVTGPLQRLAAATASRVTLLEEPAPRGNIGAVGLLGPHAGDVLVVYGDNLTAIDLRRVLETHRTGQSALTLTVHDEQFRLPYGRLTLSADQPPQVLRYDEKPVVTMSVCSAVSVLSGQAVGLVRDDGPMGLVDLFVAVRSAGLPVIGFAHADPWVDVNDEAARARAVELVRAHPRAFECWLDRPATVAGALVRSSAGVLAQRVVTGGGSQWTLPVVAGRSGPDLERAAAGLIRDLGAEPTGAAVEFDDVDPAAGRPVRHHVLPATAAAIAVAGHRWIRDGAATGPAASGPLRRAATWLPP